MVSISKTNTNTSKASVPTKAGETAANTSPKITFQQSMDSAASQIDALLRGGVSCVTYIASALLVGYLAGIHGTTKLKLSVMRDEFALALNKRGLGGTQTRKYLDYGSKIAAAMFKDCTYGREMAALIAADTPDKAHAAVTGWLVRLTAGKSTEHGTLLTEASVKLNMLGIFLGMEDDPNKPETLAPSPTEVAAKLAKSRKTVADKIEKDKDILRSVPADTLANTVATVIKFDVLIAKHIEHMTKVAEVEAERDIVIATYNARIKALSVNIGTAKRKPAKGGTSKKAA